MTRRNDWRLEWPKPGWVSGQIQSRRKRRRSQTLAYVRIWNVGDVGAGRRLVTRSASDRPRSLYGGVLYLSFASCKPFLDDLGPTRDFVLQLSSESPAVAGY